MQSELKLRILSGIVMAVVMLGATWLGGLPFELVSVLIGLLVYSEWSTISGLPARDFRGNAFGWAAIALSALFVLFGTIDTAFLLVAAATAVAAVWTFVRKGSWWLVGGIAYAGLTTISLAGIRGDNSLGLVAMIFVFAVVWGTDIFAYFIGRAIGGPKLAPRISPGKTWSGAIGGAICGVIAGVAVYMSHFSLDGLRIPLLALALSIASQCGDLFESFMKRRFGVKDSGRIIPGHGGVMDRVDGLVFACFAALLLAMAHVLFTGGHTAAVGAILLGL